MIDSPGGARAGSRVLTLIHFCSVTGVEGGAAIAVS